VGERRKWVAMVEQVKDAGGEVLIFSSIHESGKQLDLLTGVAAILSFPLPELESEDEEEGDNEG
jgi:protein pelota